MTDRDEVLNYHSPGCWSRVAYGTSVGSCDFKHGVLASHTYHYQGRSTSIDLVSRLHMPWRVCDEHLRVILGTIPPEGFVYVADAPDFYCEHQDDEMVVCHVRPAPWVQLIDDKPRQPAFKRLCRNHFQQTWTGKPAYDPVTDSFSSIFPFRPFGFANGIVTLDPQEDLAMKKQLFRLTIVKTDDDGEFAEVLEPGALVLATSTTKALVNWAQAHPDVDTDEIMWSAEPVVLHNGV